MGWNAKTLMFTAPAPPMRDREPRTHAPCGSSGVSGPRSRAPRRIRPDGKCGRRLPSRASPQSKTPLNPHPSSWVPAPSSSTGSQAGSRTPMSSSTPMPSAGPRGCPQSCCEEYGPLLSASRAAVLLLWLKARAPIARASWSNRPRTPCSASSWVTSRCPPSYSPVWHCTPGRGSAPPTRRTPGHGKRGSKRASWGF